MGSLLSGGPTRKALAVALGVLASAAGQAATARSAVSVHAGAVGSGRSSASAAYGRLPLSFVPNVGQADRRVRYLAQAGGVSLFFADRSVTLVLTSPRSRGRGIGGRPGGLLGRVSLAALPAESRPARGVVLRLRFVGANGRARLRASHRAPGVVNYLLGDRRAWKRHVPTFGTLTYRDLWPGIDLVFRGRGGMLEYEFRVAAGADVRAVRLAYDGADRLTVGPDGGLRIHTGLGVLRDTRPVSHQRVGGRRAPVASRFAVQAAGRSGRYGFAVSPGYDRRRALIIDPGLVYSTFIGGSQAESAVGAVDASGSAYVAGTTASPDFPTTPGAFDPTLEDPRSGYVARLDPSGAALKYATYVQVTFDGSVTGLAVDARGSAYLAGFIDFQEIDFRASAVVAKLDPTGSTLVYRTVLMTQDEVVFSGGIAVDRQGSAYLTGFTSGADFPTTPGAFDRTFAGGNGDAFVTKLDPTGASLVYSTFLGGGMFDLGAAITVDDQGSAYVVGQTESDDFPTTPGAFGGAAEGVFVTKLNPTGSALVYSARLPANSAGGVAVDGVGAAYVSGTTGNAAYPTTPGAFDRTLGGLTDAFVTKLDPAGSALGYSTFLGGNEDQSQEEGGGGIAIDGQGSAYVTGTAVSADFPTTPDALDRTLDGPSDAFVAILSPTGSAVTYSTLLGGTGGDSGGSVAVDQQGAVYAIGTTLSGDFPATPGAFDPTYNGAGDAFATKLTPAGAGGGPCARPGVIRGAGEIMGTRGNDVICGSPGADRIAAKGGDDVVFAGGGDDVVDGGGGNDVLHGGVGRDGLAGGDGNDRVDGGAGDDRLAGGDGNDRLAGGKGNDRLGGGRGDDRARGGPGDDTASGQSGADLLSGGDGDDALSGGLGRDRLSGGAGADILSGGRAGDVLIGDAGFDRLQGGPEDDVLESVDGERDRDRGGAGTDRCRADAVDVREGCETT